MEGVNSPNLVVDERTLTRRIGELEVERTLDEFHRAPADDSHARMLVHTDATSEVRARELLDLSEAALVRLLGGGEDVIVDANVVTHQPVTHASVVIADGAIEHCMRAIGISGLSLRDAEDFFVQRLVTEYHLLLLRFHNTDLLTDPRLRVSLPSGRIITAARQQRFR